jgi:hypothetical protein
MALGVLWEIAELIVVEAVRVEFGHPQAENRFDTVLDLTMDTVGAVLAASLAVAKVRNLHRRF